MRTAATVADAYPPPSSLPRRAGRAVRSRGAADAARSAARELRYRRLAATAEAGLRRAARERRDIIAGPFLGEVGFELLYWIPFLRGALARFGIAPEQVTVMTRGGAACWYSDLARHHVDLFDLLPVEVAETRLAERRAAAGDLKMLTVEALDDELVRQALGTRDAFVYHPAAMYTRLRDLWAQRRSGGRLTGLLAARPLRREELEPLPDMPARYVAVKGYFGDCLPPGAASAQALEAAVARLAEEIDVVVLTAGGATDGHVEWSPTPGPRIHAAAVTRAADNLGVQTRAVAHAAGLLAPYGGFSYLGGLLGVPTLALRSRGADNPVHLSVFRQQCDGAPYEVAAPSAEAVDALLARLRR